MDTILNFFHSLFTNVAPFFILLGILIFVHEFGHFAVAKFFGVRVETFSLGFGKKIFQKIKGETTYAISLIPLGGYVKMYGDDPTKEVPPEEQQYSFLHKNVWKRIAIVFAGPFINFLFAILVFGLMVSFGEKLPPNVLGDVLPSTAAYNDGFRSGDVINKIDDTLVENWRDIQTVVKTSANKTLNFEVLRDGSPVAISSQPSLAKNDNILSSMDMIGAIDGFSVLSNAAFVGISNPDSPFGKAGATGFVIIEAINNQKIFHFREVVPTLKTAKMPLSIEYRTFSEKNKGKTSIAQIKNWSINNNLSDQEILKSLGALSSETFLYAVSEGSPAQKAGFKQGDQIITLNGKNISTWKDILNTVKTYKPEQKSISFSILREGQVITKDVTPDSKEMMTQKGIFETKYMVGISPAILPSPIQPVTARVLNPFKAAYIGFERSIKWVNLTLISFKKLLSGDVSPRNIGGVITIGRVASQSFEAGISQFLRMMGIISINLFLLNLMPVPVLDGGHLLFYLLEIVSGSPISMKKMEMAQTFGVVLLLSLMTFALFNDVINWFSSIMW